MWVAKYSAPPDGTARPVAGLTIVPGVPASRCPWKSLNASSLTVVSFGGFTFGSPFASPLGAATIATASAASTTITFLLIVIAMPLLLPLGLRYRAPARRISVSASFAVIDLPDCASTWLTNDFRSVTPVRAFFASAASSLSQSESATS